MTATGTTTAKAEKQDSETLKLCHFPLQRRLHSAASRRSPDVGGLHEFEMKRTDTTQRSDRQRSSAIRGDATRRGVFPRNRRDAQRSSEAQAKLPRVTQIVIGGNPAPPHRATERPAGRQVDVSSSKRPKNLTSWRRGVFSLACDFFLRNWFGPLADIDLREIPK